MKLSEAMMLGATVHKLDSNCWEGCLLGVSVKAVGGQDNVFNLEAETRWPWIEEFVEAPPIHLHRFPSMKITSATTIISNMAELVESGRMTLEEAVDWVRSVEPADQPANAKDSTGSGTNAQSSTPQIEHAIPTMTCSS